MRHLTMQTKIKRHTKVKIHERFSTKDKCLLFNNNGIRKSLYWILKFHTIHLFSLLVKNDINQTRFDVPLNLFLQFFQRQPSYIILRYILNTRVYQSTYNILNICSQIIFIHNKNNFAAMPILLILPHYYLSSTEKPFIQIFSAKIGIIASNFKIKATKNL